jgi:hypothetical protein
MVYGGKDVIGEELLDGPDLDHVSSDKCSSDSVEMPKGLGIEQRQELKPAQFIRLEFRSLSSQSNKQRQGRAIGLQRGYAATTVLSIVSANWITIIC